MTSEAPVDIVRHRWASILGDQYVGQESLVPWLDIYRTLKHDLQPGRMFLDLGCGTGAIACCLARDAGVRVIGVDHNAAQVKQARDRAATLGLSAEAKFVAGDIDNLPINCTVAGTYAIDSLCYSADLHLLLQRLALMMRTEAILFATVWCCESGASDLARAWGFSRPYALADLKAICTAVPFRIVRLWEPPRAFLRRCQGSLKSLTRLRHVLESEAGVATYQARFTLERCTVAAVQSRQLRQLYVILRRE